MRPTRPMRHVRPMRRALAALLVASAARGNDTNYQNYIVGERALGLGGAFTALADDASGAFYNPAGLALVPTSGLSASLNIYGIEKQKRTRAYADEIGGMADSIDLEDTPVATIPTTVGLVRKFGKKLDDGIARHAFGFSTYVPYAASFEGGAPIEGGPSQGHYSIVEMDKTVWTGPVYSLRLTRRWSVGAAVFYSYRSALRKWSSSVEAAIEDDPFGRSTSLIVNESSAEWSSGEIFGRAGVRFDPTDRWSLGLAFSTPSAHLHGGGSFFEISATASASDDPGADDLVYYVRQVGGLPTRNALAPEVRAGVAYRATRRYTAAVDATLHMPVDFTPVATLSLPPCDLALPPDAECVPYVRNHVVTVERGTVVNVNVGGEYYVGERVPLRAGFFTNFSSAPDVEPSDKAQLPHVDMYGATTSVGYASEEYEVSVGVLYSFGSGDGAAWNGAAAGGTGLYEPQPMRNDFVYFYISGAQKAVTRLAKKLAGSPENKDKAESSKAPEER